MLAEKVQWAVDWRWPLKHVRVPAASASEWLIGLKMSESEEWRPGSFTKNFSWGAESRGLMRLHEALRLGFGDAVENVTRADFRRRLANRGRPDYIPLNFFLFNKSVGGIDYVVADELVFQALTAKHSARFDKLALFAFNLSYAGRWSRAKLEQRRPALWSSYYIQDRVAEDFDWVTSKVSASDIEEYVISDRRYQAKSARKLSTNLFYLYKLGRLKELSTGRVERWWVDALFLTLDRLIEDRRLDGIQPAESQLSSMLSQSSFASLAGRRSLEKDLATKHLVRLYTECGAQDRFSPEHVKERAALKLPDVEWFIANDDRPQGAIHPTNPNILKTIPRACAMLANYAGFEVIDADELASFNAESFIKRHTEAALKALRQRNIQPTMSADELMKLTRDR